MNQTAWENFKKAPVQITFRNKIIIPQKNYPLEEVPQAKTPDFIHFKKTPIPITQKSEFSQEGKKIQKPRLIPVPVRQNNPAEITKQPSTPQKTNSHIIENSISKEEISISQTPSTPKQSYTEEQSLSDFEKRLLQDENSTTTTSITNTNQPEKAEENEIQKEENTTIEAIIEPFQEHPPFLEETKKAEFQDSKEEKSESWNEEILVIPQDEKTPEEPRENSDFSSFQNIIIPETQEKKEEAIEWEKEKQADFTVTKLEDTEKAKKKSGKSKWGKFFLWTFLSLFIIGLGIIGYRLKINIFDGLPDVSQIKNLKLQEATIITDRNGIELYKIFEENREYISLEKVNSQMINAIIAIEDQHYRTHDGLDIMGIIRSALKGKGGASTIPQQLMTNLFDLKENIGEQQYGTFEYYLERGKYKLRQMVLSKRLNRVLFNQIKEEKSDLSDEQIKKEMKNRILELYLNDIEFGNNAFGIESASKSYFKISAKDLSLIQSAVLASLPKGPSQYSPFTESGKKLLMGYFKITDQEENTIAYEGELKTQINERFTENLKNADFTNSKRKTSQQAYLNSLWSFSISSGDENYTISYNYGRKDSVLLRMLEDKYIDESQLKQAIIDGLNITFNKTSFQIKAPHFVFWIKALIEQKYGTNVARNGLIVKTTLDYYIQQEAEKILKDNKAKLNKYGANNSSMMYLDTDKGEVIAYVGSLDYYDESIQGQNDMVRSPRQSWSSIKPLLYALAFMKLPLTIDSPIFDLYFTVNRKAPHNADGGYEGLLPLRLALGHSRNIPSVKLFQAVGGENVVKPYYKSLWLESVADDQIYGYSLSLWAAEVPMLELATAYSHLTTTTPAKIDPIISITTTDGKVKYQKEVQELEEIIPAWVKYLLRDILSNENNRLKGWINKFTIKGLKYALKTGTTNVIKNGKSLPRDGRMAAYIPNRLVLMRAWNTNASPMKSTGYGGEIHDTAIKTFLKWLRDKGYIGNNTSMPKEEVSSVTISKISGKLASNETPKEHKVTSLWYSKSLPTQKDDIKIIEYDAKCWGKVSFLTEKTKKGYLINNFSSIMPNNDDKASIINYIKSAYPSILWSEPTKYCAGSDPKDAYLNIEINTPRNGQEITENTNFNMSLKSNSYLESYTVWIDNQKFESKSYPNKSKKSDSFSKVFNPNSYSPGTHTIKVEAKALGVTNTKSNSFTIRELDETVYMSNRWFYNGEHIQDLLPISLDLRGEVPFVTCNLKIDNSTLDSIPCGNSKEKTIYRSLNLSDFSKGNHKLTVEVINNHWIKSTEIFTFYKTTLSREEEQEERREQERLEKERIAKEKEEERERRQKELEEEEERLAEIERQKKIEEEKKEQERLAEIEKQKKIEEEKKDQWKLNNEREDEESPINEEDED